MPSEPPEGVAVILAAGAAVLSVAVTVQEPALKLKLFCEKVAKVSVEVRAIVVLSLTLFQLASAAMIVIGKATPAVLGFFEPDLPPAAVLPESSASSTKTMRLCEVAGFTSALTTTGPAVD